MSGIYIHIPFCKKACTYCNFHFSTSLQQKQLVIEAMLKEISLKKQPLQQRIETIYFGGGTPSILQVNEIQLFINKINENFTVLSDAEITLEANPDDITESNLIEWKKMGINRLSVGIQSFNKEELSFMNRSHNQLQALQAIELISKYFTNYSVDLIYGSHLSSTQQWLQNIDILLKYKVPHISCYALTVEEKTALHHLVKNNEHINPKPEVQAKQFDLLVNILQSNGYEHYEISNFALPDFRSKHNSSYWKGYNYIGIGPSAHSYNGQQRSWNMANNSLYAKAVLTDNVFYETETLTRDQIINETIMIGLRTLEGVALKNIFTKMTDKEKNNFLVTAQKYANTQKLIISTDNIVLTKEGKFFADGIAADLFL